jgi:hypothetical protein
MPLARTFFNNLKSGETIGSRNANFDVQMHLQNEHYNLFLRRLKVHDWVLVTYDDILYPGCVVEVTSNGNLKVKTLPKCGLHSWIYPYPPDEVFYCPANVGRQIIPPAPIGRRNRLQFKKNCSPL